MALKNKKYLLIPILFVVIFLTTSFSHSVQAQTAPTPSPTVTGLIGQDCSPYSVDPKCVGTKLGSKASGAVEAVKNFAILDIVRSLTDFFAQFVLTGVGALMAWAASLLASLVDLTNFRPDFVQQIWTLLRNFVNLFFILILIVIAFATIFDNQKYNYKALLPKLIIVALLINFSFVIATTVVDLSDTLSTSFAKSVWTNGQEMANKLQAGAGIVKPYKEIVDITSGVATAGEIATSLLLTMIFMVVLEIILFVTFFTAALFLIIRMAALWGLLMIAPLAWFAYILPGTRQHFTKWWNEFISWSFFPLIYFFFLALSIIIVQAKLAINTSSDQAAALSNVSQLSTGQIFSKIFSLEDLVFYILIVATAGGGLFFAKKAGSIFSGSVIGVAGKIQGGVERVTKVSALRTGVTNTADRIQKEGLPGKGRYLYGGAAGEKRSAENVARILQKGMGYSTKKADSARLKEDQERLKLATEGKTSQEREAHYRKEFNKGSEAAGLLLNEDKKLRPEEVEALYNQLGGDSSEEARAFAKKVNYGGPGWNPYLRNLFHERINDADTKGAILNASAKAGDLADQSQEVLEQLTTTFSSIEDKLKFLDAAESKIIEKQKKEMDAWDEESRAQLDKKKDDLEAKREAEKEAIDRRLQVAKDEVDQRYNRREITNNEATRLKRTLEAQSKAEHKTLNKEINGMKDALGKERVALRKTVKETQNLQNTPLRVKFSAGLIRDSGRTLTNWDDAVKADTKRMGRSKEEAELAKMVKKLGEEMKKDQKDESKPPREEEPQKPAEKT